MRTFILVNRQAKDADIGLNARIKYDIIPKAEDGSSLFRIDPRTGQVETKVDLSRFDFKVFGFDVRATDRDGAPDGLSSIANVFVSTNNPTIFNLYSICSSFVASLVNAVHMVDISYLQPSLIVTEFG